MISKTTNILTVKTPSNNYNIYFESSINDALAITLKNLTYEKNIIVIADKNLKNNHLPKLIKSLENTGFSVTIFLVKANEKNKSFKTLNQLCNNILQLSINKNTPIISFGGGIIGDISGVCASMIYRGLPFFQIPTTLLAMVDSSIGGKCAINTKYGKNTLGYFYQPKAVFIDLNILDTLSLRDYNSGYVECLKYALLFSENYFNFMVEYKNKFVNKDKQYLMHIVQESCKFKSYVVENDEKEENNLRYLLNLGHTFGHALELYNSYKKNLSHGEAVSIGILLAFRFSSYMGLTSIKNHDKIKNHLLEIGLPSDIKNIIKNIKVSKLIDLMSKDKKNNHNEITLILAKDIGDCIINKNINKNLLYKFLNQEI